MLVKVGVGYYQRVSQGRGWVLHKVGVGCDTFD